MDKIPRLGLEDSPLGEAIREAQSVKPSEAQQGALAAGLGSILGAPPPGGVPVSSGAPGATGAGGAGTGALSAVWKWAAAACFVGGATWWGMQDDAAVPDTPAAQVAEATTESTESEQTTASQHAAAGSPAPNAFLEPVVWPAEEGLDPADARERAEGTASERNRETSSDAPATSAIAERTTGGRSQATGATRRGRGASTTSVGEPPPSQEDVAATQAEEAAPATTELGLLAEARRVLRRDPSRALHLTNQHQTQFARGALVEEREVLGIEALVRLGRRSRALARAERFNARFPRSVHASRLSAVLAP